MVTSQNGAAAGAAACATSFSPRFRFSPRRTLLGRVEADPEVGVHALLAGSHLEQRVAQVAGPLSEDTGALPCDPATKAERSRVPTCSPRIASISEVASR